MKLKFKLFFAFAFLSTSLFAQSSIEDHIRIEINKGELDNFVSLPNKRVAAFGASKDDELGHVYVIKVYNQNFEEIDSQEIKIELRKGNYYTKLSKDSTELYFVSVGKSELQTISYNFNSKEIENHSVELDAGGKSVAKSFTLTTAGTKIFMLGEVQHAPCLLSVDMHHGTTSLIVPPGVTKKSTMRIISDEENPNITLGFYAEKISRATTYNILSISPEGELATDVIRIPMEEKKTLMNGAYSKGTNNDFYVIGSYSKNLSVAEGLYLVHGKGSEIMEIKYYDFDQVKDFYSYLGTRKQERIEKKRSKNKFDTKSKITVHPIESLNDHFILLGEVYYPTYRREAYTTTVNGRTTTSYHYVFDGYEYTHAVIMEVDQSYELVHNDVFTLFPGYKPYTVRQFVKIENKKNELILNHISFDSATIYEYKEGDLGIPQMISLKHKNSEGEKYKSINTLATVHWYNNFYVSAHIETIKDNEAERGKRKQTYLVFTKIRV